MRIFETSFWEKVLVNVTSNVIVSLLIALLSVVTVIFISIYDPLHRIIEKNVPISTLLILILVLFVLLILCLSYIVSIKRKAKLNLRIALGAYWDKELNPYCPSCKTMLTNYGVYETLRKFERGMECISCKKIIFFGDEAEQCYDLNKARKKVSELFSINK